MSVGQIWRHQGVYGGMEILWDIEILCIHNHDVFVRRIRRPDQNKTQILTIKHILKYFTWVSEDVWEDAPDWANWYAQDSFGYGFFYSDKPSLSHGGWIPASDQFVCFYGDLDPCGWRISLQNRKAGYFFR